MPGCQMNDCSGLNCEALQLRPPQDVTDSVFHTEFGRAVWSAPIVACPVEVRKSDEAFLLTKSSSPSLT